MANRRKVIVDTDAGTDDAMAILVLLAEPSVEVVAITTVRGNTEVQQIARNVLRVLKIANALEIPVYPGSDVSIMGECPTANYYHGEDGLGDCPEENPPHESLLQQDQAVDAIIKMARTYPGELSMICIGPLTNLALAIRMDGDLISRLDRCVIMGGNFQGRGNATPAAEFNFYADPEAASIVLSSSSGSMTIVPWETCMNSTVSWEQYEDLLKSPSTKAKFVQDIHENILKNYYHDRSLHQGIELADQLAAAIYMDERCIKTSQAVYATVELYGRHTRGQMVVDWKNVYKKKPNINLVTSVYMEPIQNMLRRALETSQ